MQINGEWLLFDESIMRPVIRGEILTSKQSWQPAEFLVDTGADRTVFSAATLSKLGLQPIVCQKHLGGLGGLMVRALRVSSDFWEMIDARRDPSVIQ